MGPARYTKFPRLLSEEPDEDKLEASSHQFSSPQGSEEDLIRAWASILSKYAGQEDQVSFICDDSVVELDLKDGKTSKHEVADIEDISRDATALFIRPRNRYGRFVLEVHFDLQAKSGHIHSNGRVPAEHLRQIAALLSLNVQNSSRESLTRAISIDASIKLSILNETPQQLQGPELLHELVGPKGKGQSTAIEFYDVDISGSLTSYDELEFQVLRLSKNLRKLLPDVPIESTIVVPLLIPQSPQLYVAMLAVLRAGFAFCPLQLDAPKERLRFIVKDVSASLVLTTATLVSKLDGISNIRVVDVGKEIHGEEQELKGEKNIETIISRNSTAYIIYTSGSTGLPKGVAVSHQAATQSLLAHDRHIPKFSRFLQFAAPTFDVSIFEIFFTLFRNSALIVCERSRLLNDLPLAMREMRIDAAELTPIVAGALLRRRKNAPGLKLLLTAGEMLSSKVVEEFGGDITKESMLWGLYGPTETIIHCTVQPAFSAHHRPGNVGVPFDTASAFILPAQTPDVDRQNNAEPLPYGFVGELVIGGFQLADGYLNRDEQTAKAFIETEAYGRLYRTGDKARMLLDGTIECLGRIELGQVKLRGQRIELGEVRHAVVQTVGCIDAAVSVVDDMLVAFCLVADAIKKEDVLESCRNWLPTFMVPSDVAMFHEFPRTTSGKVDLTKLEYQYKSEKDNRIESDSASMSSNVQLACDVLRSVLGRNIGANQAMTSLGIDSLSAIRAASRLRNAGFQISMADLLSEKTVENLVGQQERRNLDLVDQINGFKSHPVFTEVQQLAESSTLFPGHETIERIMPCTPLQISLLAETAKDSSAYCNWVELELKGHFNFNKVSEWFQNLAAAHSMLRSGFCQLDSPTLPYACITYTALDIGLIEEVVSFEKAFNLEETDLLRPLRVQVICGTSQTNALIQIHHALYDGWSLDLLVKDLNQLCGGVSLVNGPDFALVSQFYLNVDRTAALDFWQDHLSGFVPTRLPDFYGRTAQKSAVLVESFQMSLDLERVQRAADDLHIGKPVLFQAAVAYILGGYLGSSDILIGTVLSGRSIPVPGIEDIVGPCLATCPLRIDVSDNRTVEQLLRHIQQLDNQLLEHAIVPPQTIKHICDFNASQPLWDLLFVWQESLESRVSEDRNVHVTASADRLECAITLEFEPRQHGIFSKATFHNDRLSREQVALMLRQIESLAATFVSSAETRVQDAYRTMPANILSVSNPSPDKLSFDFGLHHAVEKHASRRPDSTALIFATAIHNNCTEYESLTYKQLNDRANQLAHFLRNKGLKSAELIAICMEKSLELYIAILAVLKLGLGYLPITPSTPLERIRSITEGAKVFLCLSTRSVFSTLALESLCEVLNIDTIDMSKLATDNLENPYDGSRAAYAVFTSGSTGTPKGVLVTQHNLQSNLSVLAEMYPISGSDRLLQSCSQAFDVSVFEIFFAWQEGMCLCSATNDVLFRDIEMAIRALDITHLSLTPTVAALIHPDNVPKVRFLVTAGEGVTQKVKKAWSGRGLYQGYGPSETTNICTVKPDVQNSDVITNIGAPFRNTSAFVFDHLTDVVLPCGSLGELCFGGDQVFRGYMNQPELTASKIIEHPNYGRLYRSGDSGRILPDGSILFAARLDDQVKIRGQRVELNEINHCILSVPSVIDCATLVVEKDTTVSSLVSFFVPEGAAPPSCHSLLLPVSGRTPDLLSAVMVQLRHTLPSYMIPASLVPIAEIPMTVQGKIDRRRLTAEYGRLAADDLAKLSGDGTGKLQDDKDWTPLEHNISEALIQTLGDASMHVRRGTSFLTLGLDSISAIAFARRISKASGRDVPVSAVLRNPSVARLSQWLTSSGITSRSHQESISPLLPNILVERARERAKEAGIDVTAILPCVPLQEAMLSSSSGNHNAYVNKIQFRINGDVERVKHCWKEMLSRHDMLRTAFIDTSDPTFPFLQMVLQHAEDPFKENAAKPANLADEYLPSAIGSFSPPIRLTTLQNGSSTILQLSCHHALYDGTAMEILLNEVEDLYHGRTLPPTINVTPFLREVVAQKGSASLEYWKHYLDDLQPTILQTDINVQRSVSRHASYGLASLEGHCRELSVSLLSLCQTAWAKTLASVLKTSDICFGNVFSGRSVIHEPLDRLVAPTFNTVPFRINLRQYSDTLSTMKSAQRMNAACSSHQLSPLRSIQLSQGFIETGLFSSILLLQHSNLELDQNIWTLEHEEDGLMNFPLILELMPNRRDDLLRATLFYNVSVLSEFEAQEALGLFIEALNLCVDHPDSNAVDQLKPSHKLLAAISNKTIRPKSSKIALYGDRQGQKLTSSEIKVVEAVAQLTGIESSNISLQASIYQLGIDSIGAIQLAAQLRAKGLSAITAADVLQHPTIGEIAKLIEQSSNQNVGERNFDLEKFSLAHHSKVCMDIGLSAADVQHVWPCTPIQMGLVSQFLRKGNVYVNHITYRIQKGISPEKVLEAWTQTIFQHDMLRTGFIALDEDSQFPFAMITYRPGYQAVPVYIVSQSTFDLQRSRAESAKKFQKDITKPPWEAYLQETPDALLMHLSVFHGIYDGTSLAIILDSLLSHAREELPSDSAPIAPVLSSIITLSHSVDASNDVHRTFWQQTLQVATFNSFPDLTPLRISTQESSICTKQLDIDLQSFELKCKSSGYSVQAVGQVAWARILAAYQGEQSVCFGVVLSGRDTTPNAEKAAFPCLTTVPFGITLADQTNDAVVQATMRFNSAIRKHQFNRLSDIQRWASRDVLFDTIFVYQKTVNVTSNRRWEIIADSATDEFALALELEPTISGNLMVRTTFKERLISKGQAKLMLDQFAAIFMDIVEHPSGNVSHYHNTANHLLSITPPKEPVLESAVDLLHGFVENCATSSPDKVAFEFFQRAEDGGLTSRTWSYQDLNSEGEKISKWLTNQGISNGSYIGICFDKCPEASFAILGILKAGCAYVAIDPSAPSARQSFIAQDSNIALLLTSNRKAGRFKEVQWPTRIIYLDEGLPQEYHLEIPPAAPGPFHPDSVCYCLYTSGTTGTPKGCEITHRNAVQAMRAFSKLFHGRWDEESKWLQFASFHFDVSVLEQYWSWSEGICVVSAPRDLIFEDLEATIQEMGITHIDLTPSLASLVKPINVPSLCKGVFITGGEQLKQEILDIWGEHEVIHNGYGPTETTIGVTMFTRVPKNGKPANIGKQFDNVGTYILHAGTTRPVLRGAVGELCISGELVGKGYLNRPELTKEKFPFVDAFGERIYRTGDLVRLCHDDSFLFLGRIDDQVKLRGQRLEIGEINSTVRQSVPTITDVATFVLRHPKQQRDQLVTFFVAGTPVKSADAIHVSRSRDNLVAVSQVRDGCTERLPGYMIPTFFIPVNRIPLSTNNKTDAKTLREVFYETSLEDLQYLSVVDDSSFDEKEKRIAKSLSTFCKVPLESIHPSSNIFELGLDSISILGFCSVLKKAGYQNVGAARVMSNPTVRKLSKELDRGLVRTDNHTSVTTTLQNIKAFGRKHRSRAIRIFNLKADDIEAISPCTHLQEGMISRSLDRNQPALYFNTFIFDLGKHVDHRRLEQAWQQVCDGLQMLRTRFLQSSDGYAQVTTRSYSFPFEMKTISESQGLGQCIQEARVNWIEANATHFHRPTEVTIWYNDENSIMVFNIFHALYDGNCLGRMLQAVSQTYHGHQNIKFGPPFHDVLAYGPLQPNYEAQIFWSSQIQPLPGKEIRLEGRPSQISRSIKYDHTLDSYRKSLGVTHQAVVQAAWMATLSEICGATQVSTGIVCSGRAIDFNDADKVIGPMFNTVPFQLRVSNSDTWSALISRCHDFNVKSLAFQHTALRDINKWSHMGSVGKLFHSLFVFQLEQNTSWNAFENELWTLQNGDGGTDYPLALEAEYRLDGSMSVMLASTGQTTNGRSLDSIADRFEACLASAIESPEAFVITNLDKTNDAAESTQEPKKHYSSNMDGHNSTSFTWSSTATCIREEISRLSMVNEDEITENVSVFELGLDSIDVIKLSSRLSGRGLSFPVSAIMQTATIANMTTWLAQDIPQQGKADASLEDSVELLNEYFRNEHTSTSDIKRILPATPIQEAMVSEMIESGYQRYFNHDILRLAPEIDETTLRNAWQLVYKNSPILRTSFMSVDNPKISHTYAQVENTNQSLPWTRNRIQNESQLGEVVSSIRKTAREIENRTPSLQLTFVEAPGECFLILSLPHALYDGYSLNLLHQDVQIAYHTGKLQERPIVDTLLQEIIHTTRSHDAEEFWSDYLADASSCSIKDQRIDKPTSETHVVHRQEIQSGTLADDLRIFCREQGITLQAFGQSCFSLVLASYAHRLDPVFGVVLSGRDSEVAQRVLFPTMNTIAFKSTLSGTKSAFLRSSQETIAAIRAYQYFPLARAQRFAQTGGQKLFDSLFIYQLNVGPKSEGKALYESIDSSADLDVPVCTEMEILNGRVIWRTACHGEIFSMTDTEDLLQRLEKAAKHLMMMSDAELVTIANGNATIGELPSFSINQAQSLVVQNGQHTQESPLPSGPLSPTAKIVQAVLAQVSQVPESEISQHTTLYHIGLDSISAIKVCSLLKKRGVTITVSNLLRASTLQNIVEFINGAQTGSEESKSEPSATHALLAQAKEIFRRREGVDASELESQIEAVLPATGGQIYMLKLWERSHGRVVFETFYITVQSSNVSPKSIEQATKEWIRNTPILRTAFLTSDDSSIPMLQLLIRSDQIEFHHRKLALAVGTNDNLEDSGTIEPRMISTTLYSLEKLLPSVSYQRQGSSTWRLGVRIHHALYDGFSLPHLYGDLQKAILNPEMKVTAQSFEEFAAFTANTCLSAKLDDTRDFWTTYLQPVQSRLHPSYINDNDIHRKRFGKYQPGLIPHAQKLLDLARKNGVSLPSLVMAISARVFYGIKTRSIQEAPSGSELLGNAVIGVYIANRSQSSESLDRYPTLNLLPLVVDTSLPTVQSAAHVQSGLRDISEIPNVSVSLWQIHEWTGVYIPIFINCIQTPGPEGSGDDESKVKFEVQGVIDREIENNADSFTVPENLMSERLSKAYLPHIDVDVALRNGALDVGVFGPTALLETSVAGQMLETIREELLGLVK